MKKITVITFFFINILFGFSQNNGDNLIGNWQTADKMYLIKVFKEDDKYMASIYSVNAKILEKQKNIIWNLTFNKNKKVWQNGKLQLPDMNHSADCEVKMISINTAIIIGYHSVKLFSKERKIERIK